MVKKSRIKLDHNYYEKNVENVSQRNTWQYQRTLANKEGAAKGVAHALKKRFLQYPRLCEFLVVVCSRTNVWLHCKALCYSSPIGGINSCKFASISNDIETAFSTLIQRCSATFRFELYM